MSQDVALTTDELAALAGPSHPRWFMVTDTTGGGNLIATAQIDMPLGFDYPTFAVNTKSRSAGWTNIAPNMTVMFGSTPLGFDHGIFRVRALTIGSALKMSAIGLNDTGLINLADGTGLSDNDYITILDSFDPFGAYPRIDYSGQGTDAEIFEDWAKTYLPANFNRYPPPRVNVFIKGRPENYGTHVYDGTSDTFDISFEIGLWVTSSSATYAITLPSAFTLNSGSLTGSGLSGTINVTAPHSPDPYVIAVKATENNGSVFTAYRKIWITSNTYPPLRIVQINSRVDDRTGSKITVTLNQLVGMRPGAMVHLFDMGSWSGTDVPSAIHASSLYVARRQELTDIGVANVTLDLVGPSYMMQLIGGQSQIFSSVTDPVTWQQIYYNLTSLDFIMWGFMVQRIPGLVQSFNYTPFGLAYTDKRMTDWRIDAADLLSQMQALAKRIPGGNFGCDPSGEFMLRRRLSNLPVLDRLSIPRRASLTARNYKQASLGYEQHPRVRHLRGEAFVSDGVSANTPYWSDAPVIAGQGTSDEKFDKLVVDSAPELYNATGMEYAARNNPYPDGSIAIPKNWAVFRPAQMLPVGLDIASRLRFDRQEWSANILPIQVSYTHNPDGTIDVAVQLEQETVGLIGVDSPIPTPDPSIYNSPYQAVPFAPIPSWHAPNPNPAGTSGAHGGAQAIPRDGSVGFCGTPTQAFVVYNFTGTPQYRDVTPTGMGAFQIKHGMIQVGGNRAWLLASDGTDSKVWTTANVFATPQPSWTMGASVSGVYEVIRDTRDAGKILIRGASGGGSVAMPVDLDFTTSDYGFAPNGVGPIGSCGPGIGAGITGGHYVGGTGFNTTGGSPTNPAVWITLDLGSAISITSFSYTISTVPTSGGTGFFGQLYAYIPGSGGWQCGLVNGGNLEGTHINSGTATCSYSGVTKIGFLLYGSSLTTETATLEHLILGGTGTIVTPGGEAVLLSTDYGETFGSPITVGTAATGATGFDVQHAGSVSYAAAAGLTRKATTLGGSYSDDQTFATNPVLIETPWATRNSSTVLNTGGSPQYIVGLDAPDGSGHTLYWIVSGSPVNITPVIGGNPGIPVGPNCLCTWLGKYVAYLASFGGTKHLVTSIDGATTWADRGAVNDTYLRLRRLAATPGQLYAAGAALKYSSTFGASLISKSPHSSDLIFFEPVG